MFPEKPKAAAMKYIEDFLFTHPMFEPAVNSGQWALLQLINSEIIQHVLRIATELNIPVLPVHDEVVIPQSAKPTIELMMARAMKHLTVLAFLVLLGGCSSTTVYKTTLT